MCRTVRAVVEFNAVTRFCVRGGARLHTLRGGAPSPQCSVDGDRASKRPLTMASAAQRRVLLVAALGFLQLPAQTPALRALHSWLDSWAGIGHIAVGMERLGFRTSLRSIAVDRGWIAEFQSDPRISAPGPARSAVLLGRLLRFPFARKRLRRRNLLGRHLSLTFGE